uniref:protein-cysteine N-palmitoyltransferase HHAT-like n=1 Tax=Centroberyx gerrardi TaxID=166262 RepID=UPI003AAE46FC
MGVWPSDSPDPPLASQRSYPTIQWPFSFDHAFGPTASQDEVYKSCVQPLVESLIDGYNATFHRDRSGILTTLKTSENNAVTSNMSWLMASECFWSIFSLQNLFTAVDLYSRKLMQSYARGWYKTEEEYYLLLFSVAVCGLRFISFSLEHCWRPLEPGGAEQLYWLFSYSFYHPLFYNGPIITYKDYIQQMRRPAEESDTDKAVYSYLLLRAGRIFLWWLIAEYMIHVMYMHSIQTNETYLEILPPWVSLSGLALALVQFFYVKYLVLFGLPSMLATLDELVPPKLPRCVSIMYSFTGMWRHFDEGLYRWLIRYFYVPLEGSRHGPLYKVLSTGLAFGFVCLWHGGHDYLQYWALMNWAGVLVENGLKTLFASSCIHSIVHNFSAPMKRRCIALLSAFSTAMLILSNLVFLGGIHVGRIFWKRVFVQGWSTIAPPMLAFLYCFAQIGLE